MSCASVQNRSLEKKWKLWGADDGTSLLGDVHCRGPCPRSLPPLEDPHQLTFFISALEAGMWGRGTSTSKLLPFLVGVG